MAVQPGAIDRLRFEDSRLIPLAGARAALLSRRAWQRAGEIASSITCVEMMAESRYFE